MIAIKIATTGLEPATDEIIAISIFDDATNTYLINALITPVRNSYWDNTDYNAITPQMFSRPDVSIPWVEILPIVQDIVNNSDGVIVYNAQFMIDFMPGLSVPCFVDLMPIYAAINGEVFDPDNMSFTLKTMRHAAKRFGVDARNRRLGLPSDSVVVLMECFRNIRRFYKPLLDKGIRRS